MYFKIEIEASVDKVYDLMLGISNKQTYEQWTAMFNPTSSYEGKWEKGSKMLFVGVDENGQKGGMVSEIADNQFNQYVSIRHYGLVKGDEEITEGPDVEKWANGYENYSFNEIEGNTFLTVELDTTEDFVDYMNDTYPRALEKLKEMCEQ